MIGIIDYDAGNLRSVEKALISLGEAPVITRDRKSILEADRVILPGVGSFGDAMSRLRQYGLVDCRVYQGHMGGGGSPRGRLSPLRRAPDREYPGGGPVYRGGISSPLGSL